MKHYQLITRFDLLGFIVDQYESMIDEGVFRLDKCIIASNHIFTLSTPPNHRNVKQIDPYLEDVQTHP